MERMLVLPVGMSVGGLDPSIYYAVGMARALPEEEFLHLKSVTNSFMLKRELLFNDHCPQPQTS